MKIVQTVALVGMMTIACLILYLFGVRLNQERNDRTQMIELLQELQESSEMIGKEMVGDS